jgi:Fe-S-cluster containining protein
MPKVPSTVRPKYDCSNCVAICCSVYERVGVSDSDLQRLADYSGLSLEGASRRFTKLYNGERVLRRKADHLLGEACRFLDLTTRRCTIYEGRPDACRDWPHGNSRCVYYDMLQFERKLQGTEDVVLKVQLSVNYPDEE